MALSINNPIRTKIKAIAKPVVKKVKEAKQVEAKVHVVEEVIKAEVKVQKVEPIKKEAKPVEPIIEEPKPKKPVEMIRIGKPARGNYIWKRSDRMTESDWKQRQEYLRSVRARR